MILREQDKAAMQALMERDGINIAQATVEVDGANCGDCFIVRASRHPSLEFKARSWTRDTLAKAGWVANGALGMGYGEVHVYYRTSDGFLSEKTDDEMQAAMGRERAFGDR